MRLRVKRRLTATSRLSARYLGPPIGARREAATCVCVTPDGGSGFGNPGGGVAAGAADGPSTAPHPQSRRAGPAEVLAGRPVRGRAGKDLFLVFLDRAKKVQLIAGTGL